MLKWIRHNQGVVAGIVLVTILVLWTYGCQTRVQSPVNGRMVTRAELQLEIDLTAKKFENDLDTLQRQAALQFRTLDRQEALKEKLYEFASLSAANNTFNPTGLITLVGTLLGLGACIDNRIKDKVIKNRPLIATRINTDIDRG